MYEEFYGLSGKPFSLLPDADMLYLSKRHRMAVNLLEYGMLSQAGFIVISGEVGAGKTTVIRRFLKSASETTTIGVITNASKSFGRLLTWVAMAFELDHSSRDNVKLYNRFVTFLLEQYAAGKRTVLILDEAQNFKVDTLEELRMLSNVNNEKDQLLQIVLVGQPELLDTLRRPELRQFVQRISVHCNLEPLDPSETRSYIQYRLTRMGGRPDIFDDLACVVVHYFTGGIPRLINLLCDVALVYGYSEEHHQINVETIVEAALDRSNNGLSPFKAVPTDLEVFVEEMLRQRSQLVENP